MTPIGTVASLWRYPVKSMAGEALGEAFLGFSGVYGDRCYAIKSAEARAGFPYLNAVKEPQMLLYRPRFRHPERAARPPNLGAAMGIAPGVNPANAEPGDLLVDVETPTGEVLAIDDPALLARLAAGLRGAPRLSLVRSDRALTDCRPISLIATQTIRQMEDEGALPLDPRRFRANVYLDLEAQQGFAEDGFIGRRLGIGSRAQVAVLERDPRCKMISLDPDTADHAPGILRTLAQTHGACAGVYCAVLVEGVIHPGDPIALLD